MLWKTWEKILFILKSFGLWFLMVIKNILCINFILQYFFRVMSLKYLSIPQMAWAQHAESWLDTGKRRKWTDLSYVYSGKNILLCQLRLPAKTNFQQKVNFQTELKWRPLENKYFGSLLQSHLLTRKIKNFCNSPVSNTAALKGVLRCTLK